MRQAIPIAAGLLIVVVTGVAHGIWTNRWGFSNEPGASAARLQGIPLTVGKGGEPWVTWKAGKPENIDPQQKEIGDIEGDQVIEYTNQRTGTVVRVVVVCGSAGPISVHSPDVCYQGSGYKRIQPSGRQPIEGGAQPAEFEAATFTRSEQGVPVFLRIFWAWGADGRWSAPENPRWTYRHRPALFKLYAVRRLSRADEPLATDPCADLLRVLLPELDKQLFPAS